jgi:hypothetical protein
MKIQNELKKEIKICDNCPHCREILKNLNVLSNVEGF